MTYSPLFTNLISKNKLKYFASLRLKKYRDAEGRFIIEGIRLCEEALRSDYEIEIILYCPQKLTSRRAHALVQKFRDAELALAEIDATTLKRLTDTVQAQGVVGIVRKRTFRLQDLLQASPAILLALDGIRDPGNVGTILRTADWFGVGGIISGADSVEFTNPKLLRATMGAAFRMPLLENVDLGRTLSDLQERGYVLSAADAHAGPDYREVRYGSKQVLILGNEAAGLSGAVSSLQPERLMIPKPGRGESLNVAVAAGILLAEMTHKQGKGSDD